LIPPLVLIFISPFSLKDFKQFIDAMEAVKDKRVEVAVASHVHIDVANKELSSFYHVKKSL